MFVLSWYECVSEYWGCTWGLDGSSSREDLVARPSWGDLEECLTDVSEGDFPSAIVRRWKEEDPKGQEFLVGINIYNQDIFRKFYTFSINISIT